MKRIFIPLLLVVLLPATFSCSTLKSLTEQDAMAAIRQLLQVGTERSNLKGAFTKEMIMSTVFPESVRKALNTLNQLGLTPEVDRFTTTLSLAAEKTAEKSIPIFVSGISNMNVTDAVRIVKTGGTAATDYLRASIGSELRNSIKPVMQSALDEYKLNEQWTKITAPVQSMLGNRVNLDLANLMAGVVSESMFRKIAEQEVDIRNNASARTTPLLRRVFGKTWQ
jgi:hypothetical protein